MVGCGTGGLATALFPARDGHRVTLFERFAEPTAAGLDIHRGSEVERVLATADRTAPVPGRRRGWHSTNS